MFRFAGFFCPEDPGNNPRSNENRTGEDLGSGTRRDAGRYSRDGLFSPNPILVSTPFVIKTKKEAAEMSAASLRRNCFSAGLGRLATVALLGLKIAKLPEEAETNKPAVFLIPQTQTQCAQA